MSETKTVWLLSSGNYSDYKVHAVFQTKEAADTAASAPTDYADIYYVEASQMYTGEPSDVLETVITHSLFQEFRDNGTYDQPVWQTREEPWFDRFNPHIDDRAYVRFVRAPVHEDQGGRLEVLSTNLRAAQQAASDAKAQLLAHCDATGKVGPQRKAGR